MRMPPPPRRRRPLRPLLTLMTSALVAGRVAGRADADADADAVPPYAMWPTSQYQSDEMYFTIANLKDFIPLENELACECRDKSCRDDQPSGYTYIRSLARCLEAAKHLGYCNTTNNPSERPPCQHCPLYINMGMEYRKLPNSTDSYQHFFCGNASAPPEEPECAECDPHQYPHEDDYPPGCFVVEGDYSTPATLHYNPNFESVEPCKDSGKLTGSTRCLCESLAMAAIDIKPVAKDEESRPDDLQKPPPEIGCLPMGWCGEKAAGVTRGGRGTAVVAATLLAAWSMVAV